ncbi:MAG: phage late control D family protein [Proteobacteria bacterium]|nr:phage late control D family protein [Pseudomonadota bacterium]
MDGNKAAIRLTLDDGTDLSDKVNPRLISLTLTEKRGEEADSLEITLHNHDGQLAPPRKGAMLQLAMGWEKGTDVTVGMVAKGRFKVDEVERSGPPDIVSIRARAADLAGSYRERRRKIWKDTTLGAILTEIAGRNSLNPRIHPDLASKPIEAIEQSAKSDMAFVRDLGRRYDAVATPKGGALVFMPIGATTTAGGASLPSSAITKAKGWAWRFAATARDEYDGAQAQYRDLDGGKNQTVTAGGGKRKKLRRVYANKADAEAAAQGEASKRKRGAYTFEYDLAYGDPALIPNARVTLSGWDSEIDGISWLVDEATHSLDGSGGLKTSIKLESR